MRPAFLGRDLANAAERVRDAGRGALEGLPRLEIPGPGASDDAVVRVLAFYIRANPRNMVGVALLGSALAKAQIGEETNDLDWLPAPPPKQSAQPPLPPMAALEALTGPTADHARAIQQVLSDDDAPIPSVLRHLANWPHVIAVWHDAIARAAADGRLDRCTEAMAACARRAGQALAGAQEEANRPLLMPQASRDGIAKALSMFQPYIPRVTAGVLVLETVVGRTK